MAEQEQVARLKRSVEEWNQWFRKNLRQSINLQGANLIGANLEGAILFRANLRGTNLEEANLEGASLEEANLRGANLGGTNLVGANLFRANLRGANLVGAILFRANLGGASLEEASLFRANLIGANLEEANLIGANLEEASLEEANLEEANLGGANLGKAILFRASLFRANLEEANLEGASLEFADLEGAYLGGAILVEVNLPRVSLRGANLRGANLGGADLEEADLKRAILEGANLERANLERASLEGASLEGAYLVSASLEGASLEGAYLVSADLSRAQLLATNFEAATFTGACLKDWNTNRLTNLGGAEADYIYLGAENRKFTDRRPHSGNFKPGEFAALFQHALDTIDLIFVDGIDWQAFFASFQELRQEYGDAELNIQAIEKKGGDSFVVRLEMSEETDKAAIEASAKAGYEQQLQLIEARYQAQLQAKDAEIESHKRESANMLEITKLLASKPITVEANAVSSSDKFTNNLQGATVGNFANQLNDNAQQIYNEAPDQSLAEAAQEIQALLDQLSETYPTETRRERFDLAEIAVEQAKANLTLWQRIVSAIDAGTIGAVGEMLSHPVATFFIDAAKDLAETKPQN